MNRLCIGALLATLGLLSAAAAVRAAEIEFTLKVEAGDQQVLTKETQLAPSTEKPAPRPVIELAPGQTARVSWRAENKTEGTEHKNVLVHFFVVKIKEVGQTEVPRLTENVTYEGALTTDFKPDDAADWNWTLKIREPGNYLLRVETANLAEVIGHECYTAMDLVVK